MKMSNDNCNICVNYFPQTIWLVTLHRSSKCFCLFVLPVWTLAMDTIYFSGKDINLQKITVLSFKIL